MFFITMNGITTFCPKIILSFFIIGDYWYMNFVVLLYAGAMEGTESISALEIKNAW